MERFVGSELRRVKMTVASKGGGLILKDGALAGNCGCCGTKVCSGNLCSAADYEAISDIVFRLTFSGFAYTGRAGINTAAQEECNAQYGTGGFGITQPSFYNDYISLANDFEVDLFFEPSRTSPSVPFAWAGSATATAATGPSVASSYYAFYQCNALGSGLAFNFLGRESSCSDGLRLSGPSPIGGFGSGGSYGCAGVNFPIREFYAGSAALLVACGLATTPDGCLTFRDAFDENYFRLVLQGQYLLTAYPNGLP